ncbi:hypothetical protein FRC01_008356 [Tulasnella sp. 417]|nr:hypothetical protein FRC01_008356 [Tulasnella sp. 417]
MFYSNALSIAVTVLLSAAAPTLAAPLVVPRRRKGDSVTFVYGDSEEEDDKKPLSKTAIIIIVSVIVGVIILSILLWYLWKKHPIGVKIRDRGHKRAMEGIEKLRNGRPEVAGKLFEQPPSTPRDNSDQATLVAPPSPYSKSGNLTSSPSGNHLSLPPVYPPAATPRSSSELLTMPVPVHVNCHADYSAPVPYTRELTPDPEGEKAGGWGEKMPLLK